MFMSKVGHLFICCLEGVHVKSEAAGISSVLRESMSLVEELVTSLNLGSSYHL